MAAHETNEERESERVRMRESERPSWCVKDIEIGFVESEEVNFVKYEAKNRIGRAGTMEIEIREK